MSTVTESTDPDSDRDAHTERDYSTARERVLSQVRQSPLAMIGASIAVFLLLLTVVTLVDRHLLNRTLITTLLHDPYATHPENRLQAPTLVHPFGTDEQGRDILVRVIYGAKTSVIVGVLSVTFASIVGVAIGSVSAYYGRIVDMAGMRLMDVLLSFPAILLAIALMATLGRGLENIILALGVVYVPTFARVTRSEMLSQKEQEYADAARVVGYPDRNIILKELLPNCLTPIIVQATFSIALAIIAEAALSFLGLGVSPPTPTWGMMLSKGKPYITDAWWYMLFPGLAIMVTVLGFNLLGDSLRDALDPQEQGEGRI